MIDNLDEVLKDDIKFIDHPMFHTDNAEQVIFGAKIPNNVDTSWYFPALQSMKSKTSNTVNLTKEEEENLFLRLNFARFKMKAGENKERWEAVVSQMEKHLVESNLALVISVAKSFTRSGLDFNELLSEGNETLLRAIGKFDLTQGNRFSTYATWALKLTFIRLLRKRDRGNVSYDPELGGKTDVVDERHDEENDYYLEKLREVINNNAANLNETEMLVIKMRYLNDGDKPNYTEIGAAAGISRTWAKMHEDKALGKIRKYFEKVS